MSVSVTAQTLLADGLQSIVVSAVEPDPATGNYVREFRFFAEPPAGSNQAPLVLTIRAVASDDDALRIATPATVI